jgi:hypothetical protein
MNETPVAPAPRKDPNDHSMAVIIATTVVALTCILACAAVLIFLIMRIH